MNIADEGIWYLFVLALFLIAVAYYVGLTSDIQSVTTGLSNLGLTFTGRNSSGQFAGYPSSTGTGG